MMIDYRKFCNLEKYLFAEVHDRFAQTGIVDPKDFYMIIVWKANRTKSYARKRLADKGGDFNTSVEKIARSLKMCTTPKCRLELLMKEWGFRLSVASAILTVLYPDKFSVYDVRVCNQLGDFSKLAQRKFSDQLWNDYVKFITEVQNKAPQEYSLRDKDHHLWGRSFYQDIMNDLQAT